MKSSLRLVQSGETGHLSADQDRFLGMTMRNIERLDRLVGDLLDTSRAAAGSLTLNLVNGDLIPVLMDCLSQHAEAARQAGLEFQMEDLPEKFEVRVDRDKVVQMVTNVVGNAVKFTPAGGRIVLSLEPGPGEEMFSILVRDTGPGMNPEALQRALEPFQRVHNEQENRVPGAGLGLHITRGLARAHGGDLVLQSVPGEGTLARIILPGGLGAPFG